MTKKKRQPTTGLNEEIIRNYVAVDKLISRRAEYVVDRIVACDPRGVIFENIGGMDDVREITVTDVRIDQVIVKTNPPRKKPKVLSIPRFHVRVSTNYGSTDQAWIDTYLLHFEGTALEAEVKAYINRLEEPILARRKTHQIQHMTDLMKRYPAEATQVATTLELND